MRIEVGSLIIDPKLVALRPINVYFVSRYRQAARNGAIFPPPIVEKGTSRVVSGNHRVTMWSQEYGPAHEVEVIEEVFPDEAAVIRRFAEENSRHGNPLTGISQKAIAQTLLEYGDTPEVVAQALNVPVVKIKMMGDLKVLVIGTNRKRELRPIKYGLEHLAGQTLKKNLYDEHRRVDRGTTVRSLAEQVTRHISNGWIDQADHKTMASLTALYEALAVLLAEVAA